jgi:hypothetical protein
MTVRVLTDAEFDAEFKTVRPHLASCGPRTAFAADKRWPSAVFVAGVARFAAFESAAERDAFVKAHKSASRTRC